MAGARIIESDCKEVTRIGQMSTLMNVTSNAVVPGIEAVEIGNALEGQGTILWDSFVKGLNKFLHPRPHCYSCSGFIQDKQEKINHDKIYAELESTSFSNDESFFIGKFLSENFLSGQCKIDKAKICGHDRCNLVL